MSNNNGKTYKMGLFGLTATAVGTTVGAGVVTLVGRAVSVTGGSTWLAYLVAILWGAVTVLPFAFVSSALRVEGGNYSTILNLEGRRLAGINVKAITISLYVITGFLASISGMVLSGLAGSSVPAAGESYGTDIVTAVLLGGASLRGGKGNIVSTFVGVLVIGIMNNGMTLLSVPQFWQIFAKGVLMLLAVALDQLRERRSAARV